MTYPSHDHPGADAAGWAPPPAPRRSRGLVVGASAAGVLLLGGGGYALAAYLSGGGAQPQDVLPDTTLGVVTLDLDPSAGQKMALASLLDKFPEVGTDGDEDLRQHLVEPLFDLTQTALDYSTDVQPWLGDRMGVAVVPADDVEAGVVPVVVLAVTDEDAMAETLGRAQDGGNFGFAVREGYVLVTDTEERAEDLASAENVLADDADFAGDREALGGDQVVLAWADLSSLMGTVTAALPPGATAEMASNPSLSGRLVLGVHAEDDALEMVGVKVSASDAGAPRKEPTRLAQDLPADALGAISASGVGEGALTAFEQFAATGALAGADEQIAQLGLELPDDLETLLGTDLAVVARGDLMAPAFGARVTTGDPRGAVRIVERLVGVGGPELPLRTGLVDGGYVVASDQELADALGAAGGLGGTDAFQAAVADPEEASALGYVDLAAVLDFLAARGGESGEEAEKWSALEALGFSAGSGDEGSRFVLRVTTR